MRYDGPYDRRLLLIFSRPERKMKTRTLFLLIGTCSLTFLIPFVLPFSLSHAAPRDSEKKKNSQKQSPPSTRTKTPSQYLSTTQKAPPLLIPKATKIIPKTTMKSSTAPSASAAIVNKSTSRPTTASTQPKPPRIYRLTPQQAGLLQNTIDQSQPGDTILLTSGIYRYTKGLRIHHVRNLRIEGQGEVWIIIDDLYDDVIQVKDSSDITIRYIKARHRRPMLEFQCEGAVIRLLQSQRIWIDHCELNGSGAVGIRAFEVEHLIATYNY
ncbi:MAG: hypothetical protein AAGJ35_15165, partial [Myxococcota bacterium]